MSDKQRPKQGQKITQPVSVVTGHIAMTFLENYHNALKRGFIAPSGTYSTEVRDGVGGSFQLSIAPTKPVERATDGRNLKIWVTFSPPKYVGKAKRIKRIKREQQNTNTLISYIELCILNARAEARRVKYVEEVWKQLGELSPERFNKALKAMGGSLSLSYAQMSVGLAQRWLDELGVEFQDPLDANEPMPVSTRSFETYQRTGRAPIPVPTEAEMDAVRREVVVAQRDDSGQVRPTAAYYALNPVSDGEIVTQKAIFDDNLSIAQIIYLTLANPEVDPDVNLTCKAVRNSTFSQEGHIDKFIQQGFEFDWELIREKAMEYATKDDAAYTLRPFIEEACAKLDLEQRNEFYATTEGDPPYETRHIVDPKTMETVAMGTADLEHKTFHAMCNPTILPETFVTLDRFQQVGPPSFTPICPSCHAIANNAPTLDLKVNTEALAKTVREELMQETFYIVGHVYQGRDELEYQYIVTLKCRKCGQVVQELDSINMAQEHDHEVITLRDAEEEVERIRVLVNQKGKPYEVFDEELLYPHFDCPDPKIELTGHDGKKLPVETVVLKSIEESAKGLNPDEITIDEEMHGSIGVINETLRAEGLPSVEIDESIPDDRFRVLVGRDPNQIDDKLLGRYETPRAPALQDIARMENKLERKGNPVSIYGTEQLKSMRFAVERMVTTNVMGGYANLRGSYHHWWEGDYGFTYILGMYDYNEEQVVEGQRVAMNIRYVLLNITTLVVLEEGKAYQPAPSLWDNPVGRASAALLLHFIVERKGGQLPTLIKWKEGLAWTDQHGDPVPPDLVILPNSSHYDTVPMTDEEEAGHRRIMDAAWYQIKGVCFASSAAIEEDPDNLITAKECGVDPAKDEILRIPDNLKRFNEEDGYYHA